VSDDLRSNRFSRFGLTFAARGRTKRQLKNCSAIYVNHGGHTMNLSRRLTHIIAICVMWAAAASAQTTTTAPTQPSSQSSDAPTRPATTTFNGDTGLWFVPTAEVLGSGKWSISGYRRGIDYDQGYTNVADFAGCHCSSAIRRTAGSLTGIHS
jgi:hypothetical protein